MDAGMLQRSVGTLLQLYRGGGSNQKVVAGALQYLQEFNGSWHAPLYVHIYAFVCLHAGCMRFAAAVCVRCASVCFERCGCGAHSPLPCPAARKQQCQRASRSFMLLCGARTPSQHSVGFLRTAALGVLVLVSAYLSVLSDLLCSCFACACSLALSLFVLLSPPFCCVGIPMACCDLVGREGHALLLVSLLAVSLWHRFVLTIVLAGGCKANQEESLGVDQVGV